MCPDQPRWHKGALIERGMWHCTRQRAIRHGRYSCRWVVWKRTRGASNKSHQKYNVQRTRRSVSQVKNQDEKLLHLAVVLAVHRHLGSRNKGQQPFGSSNESLPEHRQSHGSTTLPPSCHAGMPPGASAGGNQHIHVSSFHINVAHINSRAPTCRTADAGQIASEVLRVAGSTHQQ